LATKTAEQTLADRVKMAQAAEAQQEEDAPKPSASVDLDVLPNSTLALDDPLLRDRSEDMEESDLVYPRLKLSQKMSKHVDDGLAAPGDWFATIENENLGAVVELVPLSLKKNMAYLISGEGLICRSSDLIFGQGTPGDENRQRGVTCTQVEGREQCPLSLWPKDKSKGGPPCKLAYHYVVLARKYGTEDPFITAILTLTGTSSSAAKQLNAMKMQRRGKGNWFEDTYKLSSDRRTGNKGTYNVAKIERIGNTSQDVIDLALGSLPDDATVARSMDSEGEE
jgi:hypothetical protein